MQWNKAGRPRKNTATKPLEEQDYTAAELSLSKDSKDAVKRIAEAVINQWIKDGKPEKDKSNVITWARILEEYYDF